ncbi:MAG TPA: sialidase family protein [Vicinamibacteria bacterium]|nr:sialidase family protein [Vicinamibacteria bacterium]
MALLSLAACARDGDDGDMAAQELAVGSAPGSGEPNLAVTSDGRVLLSWIEPAGEKVHRLRLASRTRGQPWSEPWTVAEGADWFVNWADFPSVATGPDGTLFAHWLARSGPGTYAYDVRVVASGDGGRTWSAPVTPHRDGTQTEHGFVSMAPWATGQMGIVWLDGRKTAGTSHGGGDHAEKSAAGAAMALMHTTVDADLRLGSEAVLDPRVCDCCQTDVVRAGEATVVAYRDRSEEEVRDISVVRFEEGRWSQPRPLARDGWQINGCPVNGPALAAAGSEVAVAWFTAAGGQPRVNVAFSSDAGATFGSPLRVDDGRPLGRVDVVALGEGRALVSWLERTDEATVVRLRRMGSDGTRGEAMKVADSSAERSSGFPRLAHSKGEVTVAWREVGERSRIRTAVVALARPVSPRGLR